MMEAQPTPSIKEILGWDEVNWSVCLELWEQHLPVGDGLCLELGCGPGGLSLWLAARGHRVICSDRAEPKDTAKEFHRAWGVAGRIEYQVIDAVDIPYKETFDIIVFKSVLGGIWAYCGTEAAQEVIRQVHKALKGNGKLLFAENLRASSLHMAFRKKFADRRWHYPTRQQMVDLLRPYSNVEYRLAGFLGMFVPVGGWRNALGHVDHAIAPLTPDRWRYVMAGVAQK